MGYYRLEKVHLQDCDRLHELRLPETVTELNDRAFAGCKELNKIYYNSTEPVVANENTFDNYAATLYIPKGCTEIYRATAPWKYFLDIQEIDFSGIDGVESDECSDAPVEYYNLQGMRVENPTSGIYIRRQGSKTSKGFIRQD